MITHFNRDNLAANLPDAYAKTAGSNNAKLLEIEKGAVDLLREAIAAIAETLDLDKATGKTLDLYGEMIGQERGVATDEQYRALIKARIARNLANSDHTSIVNAICITFGCEPSEILLTEEEGKCAVTLEGIPFAAINASNIDVNTATQIIETLIPIGVTCASVNFGGTFEFAATATEYDAAKGFGDIAQTIGGYLGFAPVTGKNDLPV